MIKIYNDDAINIIKRIPDKSIDTIISDPPYGTTSLSWDKAIKWDKYWPEFHRIIKPQGIVVLFSAQPFSTDLINSNRKNFRYDLIWSKSRATGFLHANRRPLRSHEIILVFAQRMKGSTYNPQKTIGKPYKTKGGGISHHYNNAIRTGNVNKGDRFPVSVIPFPNPNNKSVHPTQKPLELMNWLVKTFSNPEDVILDPFMGSGSTGMACIQNNRNFIGIEKEKSYYAIAEKMLIKEFSNVA